MKNTTLWLIGGAALLFWIISRQKPAGKTSPTASTGTAGAASVLSDLFKNIPSTNNPWQTDNTPQLISSASNAFSSLVKGVSQIFVSGKTGAVPVKTQDIGNGIPVDLSNDTSSTDLSPDTSYDFNWNPQDDSWQGTI